MGETQSTKLDFRRYADTLFDILFAGGQLAPGGSLVKDSDPALCHTQVCVFCAEDEQKLKLFYELFNKFLRRYKYLERPFEDALKKYLMFLKGYTNEEKTKLAKITGILLANGLCTAKILQSLFDDSLVKDGISLDFATVMFKTWVKEKDINAVWTLLTKAQLNSRLLELIPLKWRTLEYFVKHFEGEGLQQMAALQLSLGKSEVKKELQKKLQEMMEEEETPQEMISVIMDYKEKNKFGDQETTILVWMTLMAGVEWNKKEELVEGQALRHLKVYAPLLSATAKSGAAELSLIQKIQDYCYDNMIFMKCFQKIVISFYKLDVLSEDVILKWYKGAYTQKGKSVFLEQMKKFVEWLENAEEESEEEDD